MIGVSGKDKTLVITPQGDIGIGTTVPLGVLDIRGGDVIIPENNRKIGIGITNPKYHLDVNGTINTISLIASNITASNLSVIGDTTILNTTDKNAKRSCAIIKSNICHRNYGNGFWYFFFWYGSYI